MVEERPDWSAEFVTITAALRELPANFVLDGEGDSSHSYGAELKSIRLLDALHDVLRHPIT